MMNEIRHDFSSQFRQSNDDFFFCVLLSFDFGKNNDHSSVSLTITLSETSF
jgi:hypothetical protein